MSLEQLADAYRFGNNRETVLAVASGISPSEIGEHGTTAVHIAAENVDPETLELLLSNGHRAGSTDEYGRTPLHILAVQRWEGRVSKMAECTDLLLSHRCPPSRRDDSGRCFYHIAADMHNFPMVAIIGQRKVRCDALIESSGMNALHLLCDGASRYDYIRESRPQEFVEKDRMCRRMAEWLVGCGIDPEAETRIGRRAIDFAIENRIKITSAFLGGDDSVVSGGMDLPQAVIVNDPEAIAAIIGSGADPDALCDEKGDYFGMTPLMIACRRMALESAEALISGGASGTCTRGTDGTTALYHLLKSLSSTVGTGPNGRDSQRLLRMLDSVVTAQGDVDLPVSEDAGSALCFVCGEDRLGSTSDGKPVRTIAFDRLLSRGADVDARDGRGMTPLIRACGVPGCESENIVCTLLEMDADFDARDGDGMTAVMHAASIPRDGGLDIVKTLFDMCGPDLSVRDSKGRDALEIAADSDSKGVLSFLMDRR